MFVVCVHCIVRTIEGYKLMPCNQMSKSAFARFYDAFACSAVTISLSVTKCEIPIQRAVNKYYVQTLTVKALYIHLNSALSHVCINI